MKKLSFLFISTLCLASFGAAAQSKGIAFEHSSFSDIKAKARKENKLIFIDAYTSWCGPCKYMAANVFTNDTVAAYYNSNFVNAKIDMEKGEGIEIAKMYNVSCYPNLLFVDGNGALQHRTAGSMSAKDFVALGETAKDPKQNFNFIKTDYEARKTNSEAIVKYVRAAQSTCLDAGNAVNEYFAMQKEEDLSSPQNWEMIRDFTNNIESREFKYLIANRSKFDKLYTASVVNDKISDACGATLYAALRTGDETKYSDTKKKVENIGGANAGQAIFQMDLKQAKGKKDWIRFAELAVANVDKYYLNDGHQLNSMAWDFYEHVDDKAALAKAAEWAKRSVELKMEFANLDTYASVLYKLGKKEEALVTTEKAIRYAKSDKMNPDDYKGTTELMQKIQALK